MSKLTEELRKTKKKSYKYLAKRIEENETKKDPAEARRIMRECKIILINELDKYQNDELINQLILFVGKVIEGGEKANRK